MGAIALLSILIRLTFTCLYSFFFRMILAFVICLFTVCSYLWSLYFLHSTHLLVLLSTYPSSFCFTHKITFNHHVMFHFQQYHSLIFFLTRPIRHIHYSSFILYSTPLCIHSRATPPFHTLKSFPFLLLFFSVHTSYFSCTQLLYIPPSPQQHTLFLLTSIITIIPLFHGSRTSSQHHLQHPLPSFLIAIFTVVPSVFLSSPCTSSTLTHSQPLTTDHYAHTKHEQSLLLSYLFYAR